VTVSDACLSMGSMLGALQRQGDAMDCPPVLVAVWAARQRQLPELPQHLWQKVQAFAGADYFIADYFPEDLEGSFLLKPRGDPTPGIPGDGHRDLQVLFVGSTHGWSASDTLWYNPATTSNRLPKVVADMIRPGWEAETRWPTRLCCETVWALESPEEKFLARMTLFDWQGLYDRQHVGSPGWGLRMELGRGNRQREIWGDMLAQYDSYIFYYSRDCSCSFGFVCNRVAQLQEARAQESFRIEDRRRSIGYGCREYDHSIQRRFGSFEHIPLVLASLPGKCRCGAERCSRQAAPTRAAQTLAAKLCCPLVEVTESFKPVMESLVQEAERIDGITKLAPVVVPRNSAIQPSLHLGA